jgi:hypothetical protein
MTTQRLPSATVLHDAKRRAGGSKEAKHFDDAQEVDKVLRERLHNPNADYRGEAVSQRSPSMRASGCVANTSPELV